MGGAAQELLTFDVGAGAKKVDFGAGAKAGGGETEGAPGGAMGGAAQELLPFDVGAGAKEVDFGAGAKEVFNRLGSELFNPFSSVPSSAYVISFAPCFVISLSKLP